MAASNFSNGVAVEQIPLPSRLMQHVQTIGEEEAEPETLPSPISPSGAVVITDDVTTLVLKDIPYNLTVSDMQDELELLGFTGSVNLIHFAMRKKFMGYAFVNFISAAEARRFAKVFVNYRFEGNTSTKRSNAQVAHIQGLAANVALLRRGYERAGNVFIDPASAAALGLYSESATRAARATPRQQVSYASYDSYESSGQQVSYASYESQWQYRDNYQALWPTYQSH
eukprot:TRINITY_DN6511_c1_g1_i1.p1 TRINITY_DN6511_c1_g1~~TRINITY_DN6511_c1_g1_i1.p1  ORF type:complete len:241 (-),score=41.69 TRINITY_DN6511_c1_g1_i1:194-874(-)